MLDVVYAAIGRIEIVLRRAETVCVTHDLQSTWMSYDQHRKCRQAALGIGRHRGLVEIKQDVAREIDRRARGSARTEFTLQRHDALAACEA